MCPVQTVTYVSGLVTSVLHDRSSTMFWVLHERLVSGLLVIRPRSHCRVTVSREVPPCYRHGQQGGRAETAATFHQQNVTGQRFTRHGRTLKGTLAPRMSNLGVLRAALCLTSLLSQPDSPVA